MDFIGKRDKHVAASKPNHPTRGKFVENIEHKPFGQGLVIAAHDINSLVYM